MQSWEYKIKKRNGEVFTGLIDDCDYDLIHFYKWNVYKNGYCTASELRKLKQTYLLHRIIAERMGIDSSVIDHINGDPLDNRRCNLRSATTSKNMMNRGKQLNNKSGYKGVTRRRDKWRVTVTVNRKHVYEAYFDDLIEAARAYDKAAIQYHGEYAKLNFPPASKDT